MIDYAFSMIFKRHVGHVLANWSSWREKRIRQEKFWEKLGEFASHDLSACKTHITFLAGPPSHCFRIDGKTSETQPNPGTAETAITTIAI